MGLSCSEPGLEEIPGSPRFVVVVIAPRGGGVGVVFVVAPGDRPRLLL